jgi:hypothetical protein
MRQPARGIRVFLASVFPVSRSLDLHEDSRFLAFFTGPIDKQLVETKRERKKNISMISRLTNIKRSRERHHSFAFSNGFSYGIFPMGDVQNWIQLLEKHTQKKKT